jgi:raffinose/stachyose/melibiose transport system substrate-binding protein
MRSLRKSAACATLSLLMLAAAACSSSSDSSGAADANANAKVTLTWWTNATSGTLKTDWQQAADSFHKAHPNVTIDIDPIQNEQFTTKIPLALQGSNPPDVYQQWGGGQEASQLASGKLMNLTAATKSWIGEIGNMAALWQVNGAQYGVPYDQHIVGFWYRKDLFAQAGITTLPATLDDLNADVVKLKAAHIAPIAIGSADNWPDAFYWDYFAVRECSTATLKQADATNKLTGSCWLKAGQDLQTFLGTDPFQTGFLATHAQQGAGSSAGMVANGQAAMELQGDWEPGVMGPLTSNTNLNSQVGWFPFPTITGGAGDPTVALGGGDGFSCTSKATQYCAEFLQFVDSAQEQTQLAGAGSGLPVNPAADPAITVPGLQTVLAFSKQSSYIQDYFDTSLPTAAGQALDAAVADFFAGKGTPASIVASVNGSGTEGN